MRRRVIATLVSLAALVVLGVMSPARAHVPDRAATGALPLAGEVGREVAAPTASAPTDAVGTVAPPSPAVSWPPLLILAALLPPACRRRRAVVGLLIGLLALFAFESGVHSVHHLGDQHEAARCVVESASSNLSCTAGEPAAVLSPAETGDATPQLEPVVLPAPSGRPGQGRAPPFLA